LQEVFGLAEELFAPEEELCWVVLVPYFCKTLGYKCNTKSDFSQLSHRLCVSGVIKVSSVKNYITKGGAYLQ
jgi:hypothetical protein